MYRCTHISVLKVWSIFSIPTYQSNFLPLILFWCLASMSFEVYLRFFSHVDTILTSFWVTFPSHMPIQHIPHTILNSCNCVYSFECLAVLINLFPRKLILVLNCDLISMFQHFSLLNSVSVKNIHTSNRMTL